MMTTRRSTKQRKSLSKHQQKLRKSLSQQPESSSISSSSGSTSDSADSYMKIFGTAIEEEINIFDLLQQTDTESLEDEESEYDQIQVEPIEPDFLQLFGEVPNVDDISVDISIAPMPIETPIIVEDDFIKKDKGKFVDPLTGLEIDDTSESITPKSEQQQLMVGLEKQEEVEVSLKASEGSSSSEIELPSDTLEEEKKANTKYMDENFAAFLELGTQPRIVKDEIDWEAVLKAEKAKALQEYALTLLNKLIDKAVLSAEQESPKKLLLKSLDKHKLLLELLDMLPNLQNVKNICDFLNKQIVKYFRRKKSFRSIMEDNPNTVLQEKQKLVQAKEHLGQALAKEEELKQMSAELHTKLKRQCTNLKQDIERRIEAFENQVKKGLYREGFNKMKTEINRALLIMSKYRQEISEVRLDLLIRQQTATALQEQINQRNDLGNGLDMRDFITLQAQNQSLEKKIEERNAELSKLYKRCHDNIHTVAHYKEKQKIFHNTLQGQKIRLSAVKNDEHLLRKRLFSLKLQRNSIHDKMKKLRIQGGLLDKPDLMFDYDQTVKQVAEEKEKVEYLRRTLLSTQSKIDEIIAQC